jgi:hypothetical protein
LGRCFPVRDARDARGGFDVHLAHQKRGFAMTQAPKRRRSFSLRTLFVVVTASAILIVGGLKVYRWATAPRWIYQTNDIDY